MNNCFFLNNDNRTECKLLPENIIMLASEDESDEIIEISIFFGVNKDNKKTISNLFISILGFNNTSVSRELKQIKKNKPGSWETWKNVL